MVRFRWGFRSLYIVLTCFLKQEWDPTNYLVDLSGQYANCKTVFSRGFVLVDKQSPDGSSIGGLTDYYQGLATDADSVKAYLKSAMPRWTTDSLFSEQVTSSHISYLHMCICPSIC